LNIGSRVGIYRGVSVYKVQGNQYWEMSVFGDRDGKRYISKRTGETLVVTAREVAQDYALSLLKIERTAVCPR